MQEHCLGCHTRLTRSQLASQRHYHPQCRPAPISIPSLPSSPLSSLEPPPLSPLFERRLHSHLPLTPIERSAAVVLTRIGETQQETAEQIGCTRKPVAHWQHHFEDKEN